MVGLNYLKYTYDLSDEQVACTWLENPYWQYTLPVINILNINFPVTVVL